MPLTEAQRFEVRRWVGDSPPDTDLDVAFDRLGSVRDVISETLARRRANLAQTPKSFTIPGEYAQVNRDTSELDELIGDFEDVTVVTDTTLNPRVKLLVRDGDDGFPGR